MLGAAVGAVAVWLIRLFWTAGGGWRRAATGRCCAVIGALSRLCCTPLVLELQEVVEEITQELAVFEEVASTLVGLGAAPVVRRRADAVGGGVGARLDVL